MTTSQHVRKPWVTEATPHGLHRDQHAMRDGRIYCGQCRMIATGTAWERKRLTWVQVVDHAFPMLPIVSRV
jgi:hypothetical protein